MREIKFRAWYKDAKEMLTVGTLEFFTDGTYCINEEFPSHCQGQEVTILMQYTGLKDKNGLQEVYEGDIIDVDGIIKGNIYEMDKEKTDIVIQDFGGKTWHTTYKKAMARGLQHA